MTAFWNYLKGKKSYFIAGLAFIYAVLAVYFHQMTWKEALTWVFGSGVLVSVRSALSELQKQLE